MLVVDIPQNDTTICEGGSLYLGNGIINYSPDSVEQNSPNNLMTFKYFGFYGDFVRPVWYCSNADKLLWC